MPEEGRPYPWMRWSGTALQRLLPWLLVVFIIAICCWLHCGGHLNKQQQRLQEPPKVRGGEREHSGAFGWRGPDRRWEGVSSGCARAQAKDAKGAGGGGGERKIGMRWIEKRKRRQREDRRGRLWRPGWSQLPGSRRGIPDWERCCLERPGRSGPPAFPTMPKTGAHAARGLPS